MIAERVLMSRNNSYKPSGHLYFYFRGSVYINATGFCKMTSIACNATLDGDLLILNTIYNACDSQLAQYHFVDKTLFSMINLRFEL